MKGARHAMLGRGVAQLARPTSQAQHHLQPRAWSGQAVTVLFLCLQGLRVRMGIATGQLPKGTPVRSSAVMEQAKRESLPVLVKMIPLLGVCMAT